MGKRLSLTLVTWGLTVASASAVTLVPETGDTNWHAFSTSAFFDGASWDGAGCNVGNWIAMTGDCAWPGFYDASPAAMPDYLGSGSTGFGLEAATPVTIQFLLRLSAWDSAFGWIDGSGALHPLFTNTADAIGSSFTFSPNGSFALYEQSPDGFFVTDPPRDSLSQFVAFNESPDCAVIGAEDIDRTHPLNDHDFQDTVVRVCSGESPAPVPEPATLALVASGLVGLAGARGLRRRTFPAA